MQDKIILSERQWKEIEAHTFAEYPYEMCGFLLADRFVPCKNVAEKLEDPFSTGFRFDPVETAKYFPEAIAIVHSHCRKTQKRAYQELRTPSFLDIQNQKVTKLPWLIVGCEGLSVTEPLQFPRIPSRDYINREFIWTINDCYTIVQDWYRFELGILLDDAIIEGDFTELYALSDLFSKHIENFGFQEVKDETFLPGDLLLLDNHHCESNHLAVYTGHSVIHQDALSVEVPLETFVGRIKKVLRYAK